MKTVTVLKLCKTAICIWRIYAMMKSTAKIMRNIGIGLAAGTAVAAIGTQVAKSNNKKPMKNLKKAAGKAMNTVSSVMGDVGHMLK